MVNVIMMKQVRFSVLKVQKDLLDLEENMGNESARERVQEIGELSTRHELF